MTAPDLVQAILDKVEQARAAMADRAEATTDHEDFIDLTGRAEGLADAVAIIKGFAPNADAPHTLQA